MNILLLGDVMGPSGRTAIQEKLPNLIKDKNLDFVIVNGENAADTGVGITKAIVERLNKELEAAKEQRDMVVYDETVSVFKSKTVGIYTITTGYKWNKVDDLRFGKKHQSTWCYLESNFTPAKYYYNYNTDQTILLKELKLSKQEADNYEKYCKN